jgi:hypothetical protein
MGCLPSAQARFVLPGIAPTLSQLWGLPEPDQVIATFRATDLEKTLSKGHGDLRLRWTQRTPPAMEEV